MTRKNPLKYLALTLVSSLYFVTHATLAEDTSKQHVYKWVDEKGAVQYTQQQPPSDKLQSSTRIPVISAPASAAPASLPNSATSGATVPTVSNKERAEHIEMLKKNCDAATNNLKTLERSKLVVVEDEQGKARALSPEEHQAQMEKAKKDIQIYCQASDQKVGTHTDADAKTEDNAKTENKEKSPKE